MVSIISYDEWLEELIPISKNHFETRRDYYKIYIPNGDPKYLYDFIVEYKKEQTKKLNN